MKINSKKMPISYKNYVTMSENVNIDNNNNRNKNSNINNFNNSMSKSNKLLLESSGMS